MARTERRRPGPQPKPPQLRKRANLTFRANDRLRDHVAAAAAREGRSISEEIESRLERSYHEDVLLGDSLHLRLICQHVSGALGILETVTGRRAFGPDADRWTHQQVENAFADWFDRTRPKGELLPPEGEAALDAGVRSGHAGAEVFLALVDELNARGLLTRGDHPAVARTRELFREIIRDWTNPQETRESKSPPAGGRENEDD